MALSPGAEEHDAAEIGAGQARPERALVAAGVGVVADGAGVVSEHDSVDRAEPQRRRIHVVEQVHHRALAREGDVEGVVAERPRPVEDLWQALGHQTQRVEVDGAIDVAHAERRGLRHVHRRGERRQHSRADKADEVGPPRRGAG
jgi:hypothetical protein